jgi:hypothetical protein
MKPAFAHPAVQECLKAEGVRKLEKYLHEGCKAHKAYLYPKAFNFLELRVAKKKYDDEKKWLIVATILADVFLHDFPEDQLSKHLEAMDQLPAAKIKEHLFGVIKKQPLVKSAKEQFFLKNFGFLELPSINFDANYVAFQQIAEHAYFNAMSVLPLISAVSENLTKWEH